ncbi:MAG: heavy metal-binding domain-containing protein [Saprospiraceae bacterium]|nr:heavy metal-binding domain-containing protein [Saprospiraceae bacterium]
MKISHFLILALISTCLSVVACKDKKAETTTEGETTTSPEGIVTTDPASAGQPISLGGNEAHYKCTKESCTGKGDAAGKCPVCGTELVHNQAFHAQATGAPGSSPANPVQVNPTGGTAATATPTPPSAQNAKGEYHYSCAKGHAGAATAGNCGTCSEPLSHNQAYHNN